MHSVQYSESDSSAICGAPKRLQFPQPVWKRQGFLHVHSNLGKKSNNQTHKLGSILRIMDHHHQIHTSITGGHYKFLCSIYIQVDESFLKFPVIEVQPLLKLRTWLDPAADRRKPAQIDGGFPRWDFTNCVLITNSAATFRELLLLLRTNFL